MILTN